MSAELLRDLARAKAAFQLRAIETIIKDCPVCNGDCAGANPPMAYCPIRDSATPNNDLPTGNDGGRG